MLLVHGIAGPSRSEDSLWLEWVTSMHDGLVLAGHRPRELDVSFVNIDEDMADGRRGTLSTEQMVTGQEVTGQEARTVRRWWRAARFDGEPPAQPGSADQADPMAMLRMLAWSRYFAGASASDLLETARATRMLLGGEAAGQAAVRKVAAALSPGVNVVIGHALGALAAVQALCDQGHCDQGHCDQGHCDQGHCDHPRHEVKALVTVGMAYGLQRTGKVPAVTRWTNVVDDGDTLALGRGMESLGARVRDIWLDCDPRLRSPRNYFASPGFGDVLADQPLV